jgi:DNA-binding MarR family transcriptional regulator
VLVTLTDQGRAAIEKVAPLVQFVNDILFNDVSREERETMSRVALKLIRNGERAATELRIRSLGEISESNNR